MMNYLKIFSLFFLGIGIFFSIGLFALKLFFQETENDKLITLGPDNENIIVKSDLSDVLLGGPLRLLRLNQLY